MGYNCLKKASSHFLVSRTSATGKTQLTSYFSSVTCHVSSSSGLRPLSIDHCHDLYIRAWVCIRIVFLNTHLIYSPDYGRGAVGAENTRSHAHTHIWAVTKQRLGFTLAQPHTGRNGKRLWTQKYLTISQKTDGEGSHGMWKADPSPPLLTVFTFYNRGQVPSFFGVVDWDFVWSQARAHQ